MFHRDFAVAASDFVVEDGPLNHRGERLSELNSELIVFCVAMCQEQIEWTTPLKSPLGRRDFSYYMPRGLISIICICV